MKTVKFKEYECLLVFGKYSNGRNAIRLMNAEDIHEDGYTCAPGTVVIACATVNLDHLPLGSDEIFLKSYAENKGMLEAFMNAGIFEPKELVQSGYVTSHQGTLLIDPKDYLQL